MKNDPKAKLEAVRQALKELGTASPQEVSAFVAQRFGLTIQPQVIPLIRATLEDRERMEAQRASRRGTAGAESPAP